MNVTQWQKVEDLYYAVLDVPEAERAAFLARACAGEDSLRHEVEELLAARQEAGGFLSQPAVARSWLSGTAPAKPDARLGSTIGQYQLLSVLGVGGMGEVFLAEDTRLHRQVALKLLPPQFSQQPGRVRRFEQEARVTTALNHPNIVTLYDTGQHDGSYFIVNEFVDGQTLRAYLHERGPLPIREALDIAQQIATALAAAHAAGIVHRDIKPENVMLRRDGFVKVLDFGLAKLASVLPESASEQEDTHDEENPHAAIASPPSETAAGALLGTIRYMSPEQARGVPVDARTDVFSLGVVLYEMLAGYTPFQRATAGETLTAILEAEPSALPEQVPVALRQFLTRALHKAREQRWQTAAECATALRGLAEETQLSARLAKTSVGQNWLRRWVIGTGGLLLVAVGAVFLWWPPRDNFERDVLPRLQFVPVESWKSEPKQDVNILSSSPDGQQLVYARSQNGQSDVFLKQVKGGEARKLTDDAWENASPLFSPDGQRVVYLSRRGDKLQFWQVPVAGGPPEWLSTPENDPSYLGSWTRDGAGIYYVAAGNLYVYVVAQGTSRQVTSFAPNEVSGGIIAVSRDDQWLAYTGVANDIQHIFVKPLVGGTPVQVTHEGEGNTEPLWLPDNRHFIYSSQRNGVRHLFRVARDGGTPVQFTFGHESKIPWEVTQDGSKVYYVVQNGEASLHRFDLSTSKEHPFKAEAGISALPAFAPDGRSLAYQQQRQGEELYDNALFNKPLVRGLAVQLSERGFDLRWSPTGERIAFLRAFEPLKFQLWTVRPDGTDAQLVVKDHLRILGYQPSPLGWTAPPNFSWSSDGQRLFYISDRSGAPQLCSIALDGLDERQLGAPSETSPTEVRWKLSSPLPAPAGNRVLYQGWRSVAGRRQRALFLWSNGVTHLLWQTELANWRLLGWSAAGDAFYFATTAQQNFSQPHETTLWRLDIQAPAAPRELGHMPQSYLQTFTLAPDASRVAYVARQNEADNVWLTPLGPGARRQLTTNSDSDLNLGCLTWSWQGQQLSYTKQSQTDSIYVIENFK